MYGLRVYSNSDGTDTLSGSQVFYSRRENGPYYCWRFEKGLGQWLFSRVNTPDLATKLLCVAKWTAVPNALRTRLGEHYQE